MQDKNALPPDSIIAALNAAKTRAELAGLLMRIATGTIAARHVEIATAIEHAMHNIVVKDHIRIDPPLYDRALDNLGRQMEQSGA